MPLDSDKPKFDKSKLPSRHVSVGPAKAPHRSYYYAMGLTEEEIARPFVAVASAGNDSAPCNTGGEESRRLPVGADLLGEAVARGNRLPESRSVEGGAVDHHLPGRLLGIGERAVCLQHRIRHIGPGGLSFTHTGDGVEGTLPRGHTSSGADGV